MEATTDVGIVTPVQQPPSIIIDTHDGDKGEKHRKKRWEEERKKRERRKQELIAAYEALVEAKPALAEAIVGPHLTAPKAKAAAPRIDWNALLEDIDRVERLYREYREMDDEDVLLLL
ncbi:MAG: hypothetical protein ACO3Z6_14405 [Pseudomonadales bacterium]